MFVIKRNGEQQKVSFDAIVARIEELSCDLNQEMINPAKFVQVIVPQITDRMKTSDIDSLTADYAVSLCSEHPDFGILAGRLCISNLHKNTLPTFSEMIELLYNYKHPIQKKKAPMITQELYDFVMKHKNEIDQAIDIKRDYDLDYFSYKTLEKAYLSCVYDEKMQKQIVERPQYLFMRVACAIHLNDWPSALETYEFMSRKFFIHASPTLFNAGKTMGNLSSCFLTMIQSDSIEGIAKTWKDCALISKSAGGIGIDVTNVRAQGSLIRGGEGVSNGLVPMIITFHAMARYVDQGGGKRKGAIAMYLQPWHADIEDFLLLKTSSGIGERRARDLYYGLWIPDLLMKRDQEDGDWSLFCPADTPDLVTTWGEEFEKLYLQYEQQPRLVRKTMKARELMYKIRVARIETGMPYMLFKDTCNRKSNQQNLGTIRCSNLCSEIIEYVSPQETSICNLANIALPKFVKPDGKTFDFELLGFVTRLITRNLNRVIDQTQYPESVPETKTSNLLHRPIGIGVQGLADTFALLHYPFTSPQAMQLNKDIFECIYYHALQQSCELAQTYGPYSSFKGSPTSHGILQFDMWNVKPNEKKYKWSQLKQDIVQCGLRNSLLIALMPTASCSQILGNNESFEPFTTNMYTRRTLAGGFLYANKWMVKDLVERKLWTPDIRNQIKAYQGSIQPIQEIPQDLKDLYKTIWEIHPRLLLQMSVDRSAFVDQSSSFNAYLRCPEKNLHDILEKYDQEAWRKGLKTGMYYLRTMSQGKNANLASNAEMDKRVDEYHKQVEKQVVESMKSEEKEFCFGCT